MTALLQEVPEALPTLPYPEIPRYGDYASPREVDPVRCEED